MNIYICHKMNIYIYMYVSKIKKWLYTYVL